MFLVTRIVLLEIGDNAGVVGCNECAATAYLKINREIIKESQILICSQEFQSMDDS
jgi:hypothetical protein